VYVVVALMMKLFGAGKIFFWYFGLSWIASVPIRFYFFSMTRPTVALTVPETREAFVQYAENFYFLYTNPLTRCTTSLLPSCTHSFVRSFVRSLMPLQQIWHLLFGRVDGVFPRVDRQLLV